MWQNGKLKNPTINELRKLKEQRQNQFDLSRDREEILSDLYLEELKPKLETLQCSKTSQQLEFHFENL